ncbi:MAG TPA: hypothetical protein VHC20_06220 [Candidatus Paceibacterota bacterium]|nr:hypothetical protein [Candidatus Paceibacterota bacterium]
MPTDPSQKVKDSDAILDFEFNYEEWLSPSEEIVSYVITASPGITVDSDSNTTNKVTVWLRGGTAGVPYTVACRITTNQSRTDERTMTIRVLNR